MSTDELQDKVALVTGATRGLSRAIAEELAAAGAIETASPRAPDGEAAATPPRCTETAARITMT
ncbi:hypothetical protein [Streptomyces sp. NPDC002088]|uniref:hypothetical protein n=1 Tax=Streptomyces sp. NPDC002088 TaxID=3154665 RepID=UPI00332A4847